MPLSKGGGETWITEKWLDKLHPSHKEERLAKGFADTKTRRAQSVPALVSSRLAWYHCVCRDCQLISFCREGPWEFKQRICQEQHLDLSTDEMDHREQDLWHSQILDLVMLKAESQHLEFCPDRRNIQFSCVGLLQSKDTKILLKHKNY